jgi:uncharacterized membrane protein
MKTTPKWKSFLIVETILFIIGGFIYAGIEIGLRGFTHWSMFIVGGLCFVIIGLLNEWYSWDIPLFLQMLYGAFVITALELISGYILNIKLGWNIWDYSGRPFNFYGQICLLNSCLWFLLSGIGILLDDVIRNIWFDGEEPRYKIFGKVFK